MTIQFPSATPQVFEQREYQDKSVTAGVAFFNEAKNKLGNGIIILPTGSGKSLVIARIINALPGKTLVLQPTKEILVQNHAKMRSYGYHAGIYSASLNKKQVDKITFATIGSVVKVPHLFQDFDRMIIDECDTVNSADGMYKDFIESLEGIKVLGVTATPYRLSSDSYGSILKFITRTRPRVFKRVLYYVQNRELFDAGHLAKLKYFSIGGFDRSNLKRNTTGAGYTDQSVKAYYQLSHFDEKMRKTVQRLVDKGRKHILVFTQLVDEARVLCKLIDGAAYVTGKTEQAERDRLINDFKAGKIKVMVNVGVLVVGFDFPALDTVVLGFATMSLRKYYQAIGRGLRKFITKEDCWVVDLCCNIELFGAIEDIYIGFDEAGHWHVTNRGKPLTNVYFGEGKPAYLD